MSDPTPGAPPTADDVAAARRVIAPHVRRTPVLELEGEALDHDRPVAVKLELLQHSGTFKARGAAHFVATRAIDEVGLVAASGGNHGAAIAWAGQRFGHDAHIFVPTIAAPAKVERLRRYGARVHQVGEVYADALAASRAFQAGRGGTTVHAYDDPVVMAGAGTCALELEEQAGRLDAVLLACGGGGLSGGAAAWFGDRTRIVVCETTGTATYASALAAGAPVDVDVAGLAADALGATRLGDHPWTTLSAAEAESVLVTDDELRAAQAWLWTTLRLVVEPAAAAPIAALRSGRWVPVDATMRVGVVLCGANTDPAAVSGATS